ncbi:MAG TPA: class I SAM-dependent methyltransferase [Bellilinea sp.]|nr:class I SAM-dependent methyltransferase [Bellilinea sp.]
MTHSTPKDLLWLNIRDLPYFRGLLRAIEGRFYQDLPMDAPILDVGCGDGQFAEITFDSKIDVGLDPWLQPLREARTRNVYDVLTYAPGQHMPYPDGTFSTAFSNSVLEHIDDLQPVLNETSRVLKSGGVFYFCVPNHNFDPNLSIGKLLEKMRFGKLSKRYRNWFEKIARHINLDSPEVWTERIETAGMKVEKHWNYFSPKALAYLEWGHFAGLPAYISKKLFGEWILVKKPWNLALTRKYLEPIWNESQPQENGVCTFFICRKP